MALARSASGPGGLSINTNAANTLSGAASQPPPSGGLFGSASKPAGGLFGSTATSSAPQTQNMFGASQATPTSGGLFGAAATATSQPQSGGLFGSSTSTTSAPQIGGLFGSTTASQPAQTGGLFGSAPAAQPAQSGGLFGSAAPPSQPAQSGGLFGSSAAASQPQQSGGLFGSSNTTSQPQQTGGLFAGLNAPSQPQQPSSLFGQSAPAGGMPATSQPAAGGLFGSKPLFGGSSTSQPQNTSAFSLNKPQQQTSGPAQVTIPGVRIDVSNLRSTTRFNDLAEDLQKEFEIIDKFILLQIQHSNDCAAILPSHGDQLEFVPDNVEFLSRKLMGLESSLSTDAEAAAQLNKFNNTDAENARLSFRVIDNLKLPAQYHQSGIWHAPSAPSASDDKDLVGFFSKTADEMSETLTTYQRYVGEIEQHMRGLEISMSQAVQHARKQNPGAQIGELVGVLKDFELGILGIAGNVGEAREKVQQLQLGGFVDEKDGDPPTNGKKPRRGVY